ncbi:MAG: hypothetical protein ABFR82_12410 [Nitrospirota bacterium]
MKKLAAAIAVVSILAIGALAHAHGNGTWGNARMGGQMMGQAYGGHMTGGFGPGYGTDRKFLDETTDVRKEIHNKRFEYSEATRNPETTADTLAKLEKEIYSLQDNVHKKAPRTGYGSYGGFGCN